MNRWGPVALGDLSEIIMGQSPPADDIVDYPTGFPFYQGKADFGDLYPETTKYCIKAWKVAEQGDILITVRAPVGAVNLNASRAVIGRGIASVRPMSKKLHRDFLFQVLRSPSIASHWQRIQQGSTFDAINKDSLVSLNIPLPPLPVQRRIAEILGSVDGVIQTNTQILVTLRRFQKLVVDRFVTHSSQYSRVSVSQIATFIGSGITPKGGRAVYLQSGIPFIRSQNVHFDGLHTDDIAYIDVTQHQSMARTQIKPGDVLLNITGASIGRCSVVPSNFGEGNVNQHVCIVRPDTKAILSGYLAMIIASTNGQHQIDNLQAGLSRQGLNYQQVGQLQIPLPPKHIQRSILNAFESIIHRQRTQIQLISRYSMLKIGLLSSLLDAHSEVAIS